MWLSQSVQVAASELEYTSDTGVWLLHIFHHSIASFCQGQHPNSARYGPEVDCQCGGQAPARLVCGSRRLDECLRGRITTEIASSLIDEDVFPQINVDARAPWWLADRQHPFSLAAEQAIYDEWKVRPLWIREGGSLPSLPLLESHFNACVVHLPMGGPGDSAHLVNERTSIANLQRGKKVVQRWLSALPAVA